MMKVQSVRLKNFKRFSDKQIDFTDQETGLARPLIVLVGDNGSGKSTVLQAIAATLGTATRRLANPGDLEWPGFELGLAGASWSLPSEVMLNTAFDEDERRATVEYFDKVPGLKGRPGITPPSQEPNVVLTLRDGRVFAETGDRYFQFRGREYAKQIVKLVDEGPAVFERVGTVFWYTEHRTSTSLTAEVIAPGNSVASKGDAGADGEAILRFDEDLLRRRLADLMQFHLRIERGEYTLRPGQRDLFKRLEDSYAKIFPDRRFEGAVPRSDIDDVLHEPWFFLYDGYRQYEVSEMSGGERAIFPLTFDFANWNINNSVILIDEFDLHLHPPLQQAFFRTLPCLGRNNQFIITTHSDYVAQVAPAECVYRMDDAR